MRLAFLAMFNTWVLESIEGYSKVLCISGPVDSFIIVIIVRRLVFLCLERLNSSATVLSRLIFRCHLANQVAVFLLTVAVLFLLYLRYDLD